LSGFDVLFLQHDANNPSATPNLAQGALTLQLLHHSRSYLAGFHLDSTTVARGTILAVADNGFARRGQFHSQSIVQILQARLEGMIDTGSLAGTGCSTSVAATVAAAPKNHAMIAEFFVLISAKSDLCSLVLCC
jgi:hypothetical protein